MSITEKLTKLLLTEALRNPKAQKYYEIVFMQGEEADEPLKILEDKGEAKVIDYLSDWDYGAEMEHTKIEAPWGPDDDTFEKDDYILSYNTKLGYIGLVRKAKPDEKPETNKEPEVPAATETPETPETPAAKEESFIDATGRTINDDVAANHQKKIALNTLKMSKIGANILGGMNHKEAVKFLRSIGYSDKKIAAALIQGGHGGADIKEFMGEGYSSFV
jgi:hypothetical protein